MFTLKTFYKSREWEEFRKLIINQRKKSDGSILDEVTGQPILKAYDLIIHHKEELTEDNVNDYAISLNPDNVQIVSFKTHNELHRRFGYAKKKKVYLIYGAPFAGKQEYVDSIADSSDIIFSMDRIWAAIRSSSCGQYQKPNELKMNVFALRDAILDNIRTRYGKWNCAYIIGGYPLIGERERIIDSLGVDRAILIDTPKELCILRAKQSDADMIPFIEQWFEKFSP